MNNDNTKVYVRVAGKRPENFVETKPFIWDSRRDKILWTKISKIDSLEDMDWQELGADLGAPEPFLKKRSYTLFQNQLKVLSNQIDVTSNTRSSSESRNSVDNNILQNLQASRIMNHKLDKTDNLANNQESSSELSNLSVSKSALEDALMDCLQL
ncbi:Atg29p [Kluyveromyces lactis]|uniref:Autophagy-related protein 29 n=1 Tax=Kluyveromyces lactis (strain ATCC 8585 / CBS 2359 / DSM 70799 / NBRC 1267 / NRRL Y-1140 / WM37) TaxID=284590 RepID=ATG29_KLULA|nr:uncharacterized protein KLLA0_C09933g [Kluyveromyces lactis]Q6CTU8.1 RecName: Full=Autophagy-related protein 29 [Kluyveromyces lactis NRRL Y-1140]CAH01492.1 KLLA0C09933p [Kluyveromyces lactis]|eukprot:XP_452641.1 uncharacterized protein KLLA0_C09933g [Kluyveromyces lactis]